MIFCVSSPFTVPRKQLGIVFSQISLQAPTYPLTLVGDFRGRVSDSFSSPLTFTSSAAHMV